MAMKEAFIQDVLTDGGASSYEPWASHYDSINRSINYEAPKSITTIWQRYHTEESLKSSSSPKHRVLDAGCGTGLVGEHMVTVMSPDVIEIYGGDLSPDMLEEANTKNVYTDLKVVNLKMQLPYDAESFDSVISAGVFLQAHCGPECLPNIFRVLKKGRYLVTTSRKQFYEETKDDWDKYIRECSCEIVEITNVPYHSEAAAIALVIRKNL